MKKKVLLLAGGSGQRLWPLSRTQFPKQFLRIDNKETLLRKTILRNLELVSPNDLYIFTHIDYFFDVKKEAPEIPETNIICEPAKKNTGPAIALALKLFENFQDDMVLVAPSDHIIAPMESYVESIKNSEPLVNKGFLVTFGVRPSRPETGYGYIEAKGEHVERFVEKPDQKRAQEYVLSGNFFWNSGMFAFTPKTMMEEMREFVPDLIDLIFEGTFEEALIKFKTVKAISLDYAVMEKSKKVKMVPLSCSWSDIGSWEQVYDLFQKDDKGNACLGNVETVETSNSLVLSQKRLVSTLGVDNLVIIETEDALLVAHKQQGQKVKELVDKLKNRGSKEVDEHTTVNRPWGSYSVLEEKERYKIKKIIVKPNQKLSLQLHYHRSEHWVVVKGSAKVTIGETEKIVREGESIFVPKTAVHRVENPGKVPLEIIEVQVGEYLGEDDIVRLEDVYGRSKEDNNLVCKYIL